MQTFYLGVACFLLLTMIVGVVRVFCGPSREDRLVAVQLFGTTGVAVLLLLAAAFDAPALRNTAMIFVVLAVLAVLAFVRDSPNDFPRDFRDDTGRDSGGSEGGAGG